ncbi:MAG: type II CAAX endopeptidase family protein [Methanomassiliicoccus sp.]|nr:type II CAAX endopeptidase family protein [Methanomassiliicoccus sp.]
MEYRFSQKNPALLMYISVAVPMSMVLIGEAFLFTGDMNTSIIVHLLNILMCVMMPFVLRTNPIIWQSFSLVSMLRVVNLGMPRFATLTIYWLPLVYAPVIFVAVMLVRDESLGWKDYLLKAKKLFEIRSRLSGWKAWYLPAGIVLSLILANIEFKVLSLSIADMRMVPDLGVNNLVALFISMVFFVGLGEELVFRYILQTRLEGVLGVPGAIICASVAFAAMHSGYESVVYLVYVFMVAFLLGSLYYKTRSLALVTLIHGTLNFFLFSFLPFGYLVLF